MRLFSPLALRFDALSMRERVLIAVALLALVLFLWHALLLDPLARQRKLHEQGAARLQQDVERLQQAVAELVQQQQADPNALLRTEIAALTEEIQAADARLQSLTAGLIEPREMGRVVDQVLSHKSDLQLISLKSIPGEALLPESEPQAGPEASRIFKHGVELELAGSYLGTLHFLKAVQKLPWRFFWERVELQVESHPRSRVRLKIYTLSLQEGWIGV